MRKTPLVIKERIGQGLKTGKVYLEIAQELNISERVARKWGQVIKKRRFIGA